MRKIAKIISVLFHPILLPTYGFLLLMNSNAYFSLLYPKMKLYLMVQVIFFTTIFPLIGIFLSSRILNKKIDLHNREDRLLPFLFTSISYSVACFSLRNIAVYNIYQGTMLICGVVVILLLLISTKWKISIHMATIGGFTGIFFGLYRHMHINTFAVAIAIIIIAGLIGTSRLILHRHTPTQVYIGYALGLVLTRVLVTLFV